LHENEAICAGLFFSTCFDGNNGLTVAKLTEQARHIRSEQLEVPATHGNKDCFVD